METTEMRKINLEEFGDLFHKEPSELSDQELLSMDFILHRGWSFLRAGHKVFSRGKLWDYKDLLDHHAMVRNLTGKWQNFGDFRLTGNRDIIDHKPTLLITPAVVAGFIIPKSFEHNEPISRSVKIHVFWKIPSGLNATDEQWCLGTLGKTDDL
jgi:hypothetical protein